MFKIQTYNVKISDEHDALDPECPTYKRAIQEEKKRAGWEDNKQQLQKEEELILYTNAQSLIAHKDEIQHQIMKKVNPAIIALSETRLTNEIEDSEVSVPGYTIIRCDAENRNTGGAILYVRNDIKYDIVLVKKIVSNCWCIAIETKLYKGVIMVLYHSPSASHGEFVRFLEDIVEELVIKGDCMVTVMASLGMKQYVKKPTRVTKDSKTIIDLCFANNKIQVQVMHEPKITDHAWLRIILNANKNISKYREFSGRNYSEFNVDEFNRLIEDRIGQSQGLEVSERAKKFVDNIVDALDNTAPKKKFRIPRVWEGKKWFSDDIREAATRRDVAYNNALFDDTQQKWMQFKSERNKVVKLIKEKKKEYYENMIDCNKNDPTKMWKTLKELIRGEPMHTREIENIDFEILNDMNECNIADKFNMYYIQSINNIVKSIDSESAGPSGSLGRRTIYAIENNDNIIENFEMIKIEDLEEIITGLPNKKGTEEGITSDILKVASCVVKEEFVDLINNSLREGCFPESWKTSTIIPIPKIEKAKKASEYRPINMLEI